MPSWSLEHLSRWYLPDYFGLIKAHSRTVYITFLMSNDHANQIVAYGGPVQTANHVFAFWVRIVMSNSFRTPSAFSHLVRGWEGRFQT